MILLVPIAVGVLLGLARGGRLGNLADLPVRFAWVPIPFVVVQAALVAFAPADATSSSWARPMLLAATYTGMLAFLTLNFRIPGSRFLILGALLNLAVMLANRGYMPVTPEALVRSGHEDQVIARGEDLFVRGSKDIVLEASETRLGFLSDVIGIPEALPFSATFSVGDLLIGFGAGSLIASAMVGRRRVASGQWSVVSGIEQTTST